MKAAAPLELRHLKAMMELKGLTLRDVSDACGVNYTACSLILNGKRVSKQLARIASTINTLPAKQQGVENGQ